MLYKGRSPLASANGFFLFFSGLCEGHCSYSPPATFFPQKYTGEITTVMKNLPQIET
jgi:hypothetical protein